MINRTKIASLAVCAILSAAVLTGCGGSSASSSTASSAAPAASSQAASSVVSSAAAEENGASDLDGIYNALLQADPISNQFEIAAMNIEYDFGLQAEDVVSYKGVKSNDNGDAGLVLVIEAADGKAEDIANQLTAYQQDQVAFYGNYAEFAQAQSNVENAIIDGGDDLAHLGLGGLGAAAGQHRAGQGGGKDLPVFAQERESERHKVDLVFLPVRRLVFHHVLFLLVSCVGTVCAV